jgi:hypothetical protein
MFSSGIFQPIIGNWIDEANTKNAAAGFSEEMLKLSTGQETLEKMMIFPILLIALFTVFFFWQKNTKSVESVPTTYLAKT